MIDYVVLSEISAFNREKILKGFPEFSFLGTMPKEEFFALLRSVECRSDLVKITDSFSYIAEQGIKAGDRVRRWNEGVYIVKKITKEGKLILKNRSGIFSAHNFKKVK